MKKDEKEIESPPENERKESEKELNEIKAQHKGRYPKSVAEKTKALKIKTRRGIPVVSTKLDLFLGEYFRNGGNATAAAMVVFNCSSRSVASVIGSNYLKKAQGLGRLILEEEGATYARLVRMALAQMDKPKADGTFVALWDRLMKLGGYEDFMPQKGAAMGTTVNVMNIQKDLMKKYVDGSFDMYEEAGEVTNE